MENKNDNTTNQPREDLHEYAIDATLDQLDSTGNRPDSEKKREEVVIGTRSLAQFLGIEEPSLKKQLFEQSPMEQDFITGRYIERLRESGSLADAGRDLANCLTYGTDYDLKLGNMPRPQLGLNMPTPTMGGGGGMQMGGGTQPSSPPPQQTQQQSPPDASSWPPADFLDKDKS